MKVLALVEISEYTGKFVNSEPEQIFIKNTDLEKIDLFFENIQKMKQELRVFHQIKDSQRVRMDANFHEIANMGFVTCGELDKFLEKKLIEIQDRITIAFYWRKYVSQPTRKIGIKIITKIGGFFFKKMIQSQ